MPSPLDLAAGSPGYARPVAHAIPPPAPVLVTVFSQITHEGPPPARSVSAPVNRPITSTGFGDFFSDSIDPKLRWYVPTIGLAPDPDPAFAFHADTDGVDTDGRPFHKAKLTFTVQKSPPDAATAWMAANPGGTIREITLTGLDVSLIVTFKEPTTGQFQMASYPIALAPATAPGSPPRAWIAIVDGVLGDRAIILYQNLTAGGAQVASSGEYDVFSELPSSTPTFVAISSPIYVAKTVHWAATFLVQRKFAADPYQLRYTLDLGGQTKPILGADELDSFNFNQSEYMPLRQLGDVTARYPTIGAPLSGRALPEDRRRSGPLCHPPPGPVLHRGLPRPRGTARRGWPPAASSSSSSPWSRTSARSRCLDWPARSPPSPS